ncbi:MAG: hypothetical protein OQJ78_10050, partial [Ignavibacteriaceae bacterium]|nr:hypothetical protein [Ignavibacteriaceae bacterium]
MNQKLQNILDIIQQSERLDSEQKDNLLKAVNDADKELEITAFKLERTEKVKKTTAILLEETIEELEQKRKAVEAQNRELEIEASLERVRAIAMGMDKSDDLLAVCEIFFKEFTKLGFNALRNGLINIFNDEQKFLVNYDYSDYMGGSISNVSYNSNPANDEFLINIRKANDAFVETIIDRDQLDEWKEFRRSHGEADDPRLDNIKALYYYNYSFGSGSIGISNFEPISEEQQIILKRFRNVFNLSYQRYSDIALAEAQTREAQIEASLERVRAVSMAMHKPEDLLNVSKIQFKEFKKLGFSDIRNALIAIFNDEEEYFLDHDYSDDTGGNINKVPYNSHPEIDKLLTQSRKANDAFVELVIDKDQLDRWKEFRRSHGEEDDPRLSNIDALYYYNYSIGIGVVGFSTTKPIGEEYLKVLKRFRNVFDLAYRRYIDIAQAEAQAREAQIEASLEKVRAVAMSMNRSEDLLSICEVSFKEFKKLGFDNIRNALIHIQYDEQKYFMDYDFSDLTGGAITKLEYGSHPVVEDYLQQIRSAKDAFYQGVIKEDQLEEWKDFRRNSGQIDDPRLKKSTALYYYFFSIGIGDIGISTLQPINEYQIKILKRFRNVFDLAYRRYTDITKAEAQAREAQIEAALERVRTNAMAMQSSNDFAKIVEIVFTELKKVGFETLRCGIGIIESAETKKVDIWSTTLADEDLSIQISGDEVLEGHALLDGIIEHWINQTEFSYVL